MTIKGVLRLPGEVVFGRGTRGLIPGLVARHGNRVLVIADPALAATAEFAELVAALAATGLVAEVRTDIAPELPVASLDEMAQAARTFNPDALIAYGGGSALDAAKLVAVLLSNGGRLSDYYGENAVPGPVLPVVAVPTTAGTGSEVTPVAVVSDPAREMKVGISSPYIIPRYAVVDPDLTMGAPSGVTAHSGIDALVHAVESYTTRPLPIDVAATEQPVFTGRNALSEPMSLAAVRSIGPALETAVRAPGDVAAREAMAFGSLAAGIAFGATGTHLSHALQYPIGAMTHTPHGLGTGMMLPFVLVACAPAIGDRLEAIGSALGLAPGSDLPARTIARIAQIGANIGLPATLADIGITRADLPRIAELAMLSRRLINVAPIDVDVDVLRNILESAYVGSLTPAINV